MAVLSQVSVNVKTVKASSKSGAKKSTRTGAASVASISRVEKYVDEEEDEEEEVKGEEDASEEVEMIDTTKKSGSKSVAGASKKRDASLPKVG